MSGEGFREESDLLGTRMVPKDAYWGIQTLRAQENFDVSRVNLSKYSTLIQSLAMVKKACALANEDLGHFKPKFSKAIIQACDEIVAGELEDQFVVDMLQGGAGTSTNMCMNEVIASRANEILGEDSSIKSPQILLRFVAMTRSNPDAWTNSSLF
ncbi:unnamed protein product [marine sediment metagenome]|uniref:Fumarate lyase N-terminal domain-containing protein n=1 Tax=marine sediment metagenome TaxID=412755 RepID=X1B407_9ZZZZ